jgi:hypothetical protein
MDWRVRTGQYSKTVIDMTREEQAQIVRQQRAGFASLDRFEREAERKMTFADRLAAFERIQSLAPYLAPHDSRSDDDQVTQAWIKIRARYAALQQPASS